MQSSIREAIERGAARARGDIPLPTLGNDPKGKVIKEEWSRSDFFLVLPSKAGRSRNRIKQFLLRSEKEF
jgi:hypothetical protein